MSPLHQSWKQEQASKPRDHIDEQRERLHKLMRSYNPDLPMAPGMKAQFQQIMYQLEMPR